MSWRRGRRSQRKTAPPGRRSPSSCRVTALLREGNRWPGVLWERLPGDAVAPGRGSAPFRCSNGWQFAAPGRREAPEQRSKALFLQAVEEEGEWGVADGGKENAMRGDGRCRPRGGGGGTISRG